MNGENFITSFADISRSWPLWARARSRYVIAVQGVKSCGRRVDATSGWIRFPFYHHVFGDEVGGFARQLRVFRNYGEFLSLDEAVGLIRSGNPIDGRYFCITFDDGIDGCHDHAFPLLSENGVPAAFFIVPDFMPAATDGGERRLVRSGPGLKINFRYMNWADCRRMAAGGMTIGSHTCSHRRLSAISDEQARAEMAVSKARIEAALGQVCAHFACPWGRPGIDFEQNRHELMARDAGYESFLAVERGVVKSGDSPYFIRRDFLYANWGGPVIRYYFGS